MIGVGRFPGKPFRWGVFHAVELGLRGKDV